MFIHWIVLHFKQGILYVHSSMGSENDRPPCRGAAVAEQSLGLHGYCDSKGWQFALNRGNDLEVLRMLHEDYMTLSLHRQSRRNLPLKVPVVQGI